MIPVQLPRAVVGFMSFPAIKWLKFGCVPGCVRLMAVAAVFVILGSSAVFGAVATTLPVLSAMDSSDDGHVAANAVDGSLATRWSADGDGQWLRLDLGTSQRIGGVSIAWYQGDQRKAAFDIQS